MENLEEKIERIHDNSGTNAHFYSRVAQEVKDIAIAFLGWVETFHNAIENA